MANLYDSYRQEEWDIFTNNMTVLYNRDIGDLAAGKIHALPCFCWLCLWRRYIALPTKKAGRRFDMLTFLVWDILNETNDEWLLKNGYKQKMEKNGKTLIADKLIMEENGIPLENYSPFAASAILTFGTGDYAFWRARSSGQVTDPQVAELVNKLKEKNYAVRKVSKKIFASIDLFSPEGHRFLGEYRRVLQDRLISYSKEKRYHRLQFLKLLGRLEYEIWNEWQRKQPGYLPQSIRTWKKSLKPGILSQKIADFIYSLPDKKATRRYLQRRFNIKRGTLEDLHEWLKLNYGIDIKPENRSLVYTGTMTTSCGRILRIGAKPH